MRELAVRSGWTRATENVGPTVNGQWVYAIPADTQAILNVAVGGVAYQDTEINDVREITAGNLALRDSGLYYSSFLLDGTEALSLYPVPTANGIAIDVRFVYAPADLVGDTNIPPFPEFAHRGIVYYAAAEVQAMDEDNADLAQTFMAVFDSYVQRLRALRLSRDAAQIDDVTPASQGGRAA